MTEPELIPHLFRTEYSRITAVLSKLFGLDNIEVAEDIASETFLTAVETWPYKGIPENPTAWLYKVAKNKAKNYLKHHKIFSDKIAVQLKSEILFGVILFPHLLFILFSQVPPDLHSFTNSN